jgi:hydrogenase-4 component F
MTRIALLCLLPAAAGAITFVIPAHRAGRWRVVILVAAAAVHLAMTLSFWSQPARPALGGWLEADALGLLVLTLASSLFFLTSIYVVGYIRQERPRGGRVFVAGLLAFLTAVSIVSLAQHFALLWVGMEAATLSLAPLVFHRHDRRSLEAVWKYLVISSVGIALALLGIFFLATAQSGVAGRPLIMADLIGHAREMDGDWLRAAFLFLVVGFGTKMGLAPMHTWKPDTYGEAPSLVGGLMAGALTTCAFLGVARAAAITNAAGLEAFTQPVLITFGLLSLGVAAAFIISQQDIKRLLAYSSVEHMGILVLGLGLGGTGIYGSVLHALNNGLAKGWLFLVVGNIGIAARQEGISMDHGLARTLPLSGALLIAGLFAVTGSPPFGLFISEFTILRGAISGGHVWIAAAMLVLLAIIFIGIAGLVLDIALGAPAPGTPRLRESPWLIAGPVVLATAVLMLGLHIPAPVRSALASAAAMLGGSAP